MHSVRTTVNIDLDALRAASSALGTQGTSTTVNAALREAARRRILAGFDVMSHIDGTPAEVEIGRERGELGAG